MKIERSLLAASLLSFWLLAPSAHAQPGNASAPAAQKEGGPVKITITTSNYPAGLGTSTGGGTVAVGSSVTLKATAKTGASFVDWTINGSVVSASATYKFTAGTISEKVVANFADVSVPTLGITTPANGAKVGASLLAISGTANNVLGVASVVLTLGGNPVSATTTNNWTNWSASVLLAPGANVIAAYALSEVGRPSPTITITVTDTNSGFAPVSLAGLIARVESSTDGSLVLSFGTATVETFHLLAGKDSAVGNYTYTQTGPDTAILINSNFAPPNKAGSGGEAEYLTFTSPSTANASNEVDTSTATVSLSPGPGQDVSSLAGVTSTSTDISNNTNTTVFGDATFRRTNSDLTTVSGMYTSTQYGPMSAMIVMTNADIYNGGVETNFSLVWYASPSNGSWFVTSYNGIGGGPFFDSGTFTGVYHPTGVKYVAPESLNGITANVSVSGQSFTTTFGQATFAQTSASTNNNNNKVCNYVYARTGAKTAALYMYDYLPPSTNITAVLLTFESSGSASFPAPEGGRGTGSVTLSVLPQKDYYAPAALTDLTVDSVSGGKSKAISFYYGSVTNVGSAKYGTYTYSLFSPTVGMLVETATDPADAGETDYVQLTFTSTTAGNFFSTKSSDGSISTGTFSIPK
jgi:hypothetical protein